MTNTTLTNILLKKFEIFTPQKKNSSKNKFFVKEIFFKYFLNIPEIFYFSKLNLRNKVTILTLKCGIFSPTHNPPKKNHAFRKFGKFFFFKEKGNWP